MCGSHIQKLKEFPLYKDQTDSELIVAPIRGNYSCSRDVRVAFSKIEGTFASLTFCMGRLRLVNCSTSITSDLVK